MILRYLVIQTAEISASGLGGDTESEYRPFSQVVVLDLGNLTLKHQAPIAVNRCLQTYNKFRTNAARNVGDDYHNNRCRDKKERASPGLAQYAPPGASPPLRGGACKRHPGGSCRSRRPCPAGQTKLNAQQAPPHPKKQNQGHTGVGLIGGPHWCGPFFFRQGHNAMSADVDHMSAFAHALRWSALRHLATHVLHSCGLHSCGPLMWTN